jgi:hypothetical protein
MDELVKMPSGIPRGYAYGLPQIKTDAIFFRAGNQTWEFPAGSVLGYRGIATSCGDYYLAKIKDLRKLAEKEEKNGRRN